MENYINDLLSFLKEDDYQAFLSITKGKEEEISRIDLSGIENFNHQVIPGEYTKQFKELYQSICYYFGKRGFYYPKMQEGIALVISKGIILNRFSPCRMTYYFQLGNRGHFNELANPFEEVARLLLMATKESLGATLAPMQEFKGIARNFEDRTYLQMMQTSFNEDCLKKEIHTYAKEEIIDQVGEELELSNIDSKVVHSASSKEASNLLLRQCDIITGILTSKVEQKAFLGELYSLDYRDKLLSRFNNAVVYAKRNIGVYEPTKELKKTYENK